MAGVRLGSRNYEPGRYVERVAYYLENQREGTDVPKQAGIVKDRVPHFITKGDGKT